MSSWEEKYNKLKQEFDDYKESVKKVTPKKRMLHKLTSSYNPTR